VRWTTNALDWAWRLALDLAFRFNGKSTYSIMFFYFTFDIWRDDNEILNGSEWIEDMNCMRTNTKLTLKQLRTWDYQLDLLLTSSTRRGSSDLSRSAHSM
jgi:hypothetical protein